MGCVVVRYSNFFSVVGCFFEFIFVSDPYILFDVASTVMCSRKKMHKLENRNYEKIITRNRMEMYLKSRDVYIWLLKKIHSPILWISIFIFAIPEQIAKEMTNFSYFERHQCVTQFHDEFQWTYIDLPVRKLCFPNTLMEFVYWYRTVYAEARKKWKFN